MKIKRVFAGILSTIILGGALTVSAATTHEHTFEGHYSYEEAYCTNQACNVHYECTIRTQYLNVFDSCTSCGFRTYVKTEMKVMHIVTILDKPFR